MGAAGRGVWKYRIRTGERMSKMEQTRAKELAITAAKIRLAGLEAVHTAASGHIGGSLSVTDVLTVLYFDKMHIDPQNPQDQIGRASCRERV